MRGGGVSDLGLFEQHGLIWGAKLRPLEKLVYFAILKFFPSFDTLQGMTGLSRSALSRALKGLEAAQGITVGRLEKQEFVVGRQNGVHSAYLLTPERLPRKHQDQFLRTTGSGGEPVAERDTTSSGERHDQSRRATDAVAERDCKYYQEVTTEEDKIEPSFRNLDQALKIPIRKRALHLIENEHKAGWLMPNKWPEVLDLSRTICSAMRWRHVDFRKPTEKTVLNLVAVLEAFSADEIAQAVKAAPSDPWLNDGQKSIRCISVTVFQSLLSPNKGEGKPKTADEVMEERNLRRKCAELGVPYPASSTGSVISL
jgi:hypothetical protein